MSLEKQENFPSVLAEEFKKMSLDQLKVWIKEERDNQMLIKAADILQEEISRTSGEDKGELSRRRSLLMKRIAANKKIQQVNRSYSTAGLSRKKVDYNV